MVREHSTPARTALGFALGSFIGIFPSFAVGTPIAFFLAGRLRWNRGAAVAGTFLMNPFTAPLFYSTSTWLGMEILGQELEAVPVQGVLNYLRHFGLAFLVGNTLFALAFAATVGGIIFLLARSRGRFRPQDLELHLQAEPVVPASGATESAQPSHTDAQEPKFAVDGENLSSPIPFVVFDPSRQPSKSPAAPTRLSA